MKTIKDSMMKSLANSFLKSARKQSNSACMMFGYEPKKPEGLRKEK